MRPASASAMPLTLPFPGPRPSLTIIIPTYNEQSTIAATISAALRHASPMRPEILVADGCSTDGTAAAARRAGASAVLTVVGGRAKQLNAAARTAAADTLFFLHADSLPPAGYPRLIADVLLAPMTVAGAFRLSIASPRKSIRFVECVVNARSRLLQLPYGDQGLFLSRDTFDAVGGYPDMLFMDDYAMSRRLAASGRGRLRISSSSVITSARRWETLGVVRTSIINQLVVLGYQIGVPVPTLQDWYRGSLRRALAIKDKQQQ
jgi:rSAM/selenodomain-associated transferase 2